MMHSPFDYQDNAANSKGVVLNPRGDTKILTVKKSEIVAFENGK